MPHQHGQVEQRDAREAVPGIGGKPGVKERGGGRVRLQILVDGDLGEQRAEHLQNRLQQKEDQGERYQYPVGAHIAQQAAHQPGVVGFTEDLFFHEFRIT